jgi:hypothetical protein
MESYAATSPHAETIATVQETGPKDSAEESKDSAPVAAVDPTVKLGALLKKLMERVEVLKKLVAPRWDRVKARSECLTKSRGSGNSRGCWNCQQPGHISRNCPHRAQQGN